MALGNAIGIPFGNIGFFNTPPEGVLDFNNTYFVSLPSIPDVKGTVTISFKLFLENNAARRISIEFYDGTSDYFTFKCGANTIQIRFNTTHQWSTTLDLPVNKVLDVEITKTTGSLTNLVIDGETIEMTDYLNNYTPYTTGYFIGLSIGNTGIPSISQYGYVYDLDFNSSNTYIGYPNGDQNSAWEDTTGSIDGIVSTLPL